MKAYETSGNVLFEEKQKFPSWLTLLMGSILLLTIVIILITGFTRPEEDRKEMWAGLVVAIAAEIFVIALFLNVQLEKIVTTNGLYYRWSPWQKRFRVIEKESIKGFELRSGPPLNYGIHWFPGYGWVHNASTGEGLQLYLVNGRRMFFSTADASFFRRALQNLISFNPKQSMSEF